MRWPEFNYEPNSAKRTRATPTPQAQHGFFKTTPVYRQDYLKFFTCLIQVNVTLAAVRRIVIIAMVKGDVRTVLERTATTATEGNSVQDRRGVIWSTKLLVS